VMITLDVFVVPHGPDGAEATLPLWTWIVPVVAAPAAVWLLRRDRP
jgi:hypothetical protein